MSITHPSDGQNNNSLGQEAILEEKMHKRCGCKKADASTDATGDLRANGSYRENQEPTKAAGRKCCRSKAG